MLAGCHLPKFVSVAAIALGVTAVVISAVHYLHQWSQARKMDRVVQLRCGTTISQSYFPLRRDPSLTLYSSSRNTDPCSSVLVPTFRAEMRAHPSIGVVDLISILSIWDDMSYECVSEFVLLCGLFLPSYLFVMPMDVAVGSILLFICLMWTLAELADLCDNCELVSAGNLNGSMHSSYVFVMTMDVAVGSFLQLLCLVWTLAELGDMCDNCWLCPSFVVLALFDTVDFNLSSHDEGRRLDGGLKWPVSERLSGVMRCSSQGKRRHATRSATAAGAFSVDRQWPLPSWDPRSRRRATLYTLFFVSDNSESFFLLMRAIEGVAAILQQVDSIAIIIANWGGGAGSSAASRWWTAVRGGGRSLSSEEEDGDRSGGPSEDGKGCARGTACGKCMEELERELDCMCEASQVSECCP
ncbi:unnamed protein product [Taenia asiatica]|uniref:Uncharacterized protein n=1 Tax=Taenia asiatica TaxID=60517 RepID=A0A3P6NPL7_TAEAS|nr:unnamed protein product [Taenia asiatica]